jgi:ATP-dependent helicase/nuclease subunit A
MSASLRQVVPELSELAGFRQRRPSELFLFLQSRYSLVQRYEEVFNPGKAANLRLFWTAALSLEGKGVATIGRFLRYLEKMADSRDLTDAPLPAGAGTGAVRFLTVHGAKGLEAPVIILPDTARTGPGGVPEFLPVRTGVTREIAMLLPHLGGQYPLQDLPGVPRSDVYLDAQDQEVARGAEEDASLAYVALTRARDYLLIAGFMSRARTSYDRTIHGACTAALDKVRKEPADPKVRLVSEDVGSPGEDGEIPRWGRRYTLESGVRPQSVSIPPISTLPPQPHLPRLPEGRSVLLEVRHPSVRAGREDEEPTTGMVPAVPRVKAGSEGLDPRQFGNAVHRILGWLGTTGRDRDIASGQNPGSWKDDAMALSAAELPEEHQARLAVQHVESLLNDASLSWVFQTSSLSEQPMILQSGDKTVQYGIADRVVLEENRITVVDYKTHALAGPVPEEVMQGYHAQVTQYVACLEAMCPGRPVRGCLLWTHSHRLDWVPVVPSFGNPPSNTPE